MEGTATVEQAEPQGSAAPGQDTSAPAPGDDGAASPSSFGSLYRQHVSQRAERQVARRAGVSSADRETSARDEQPAPSTAADSRPGAGDGDGDTAGVEADSLATDQPRLTRRERKALATGQPSGEQPVDTTATADTSAATTADDDDPVIARVGRIEQTVTEGLSRLEGLLKPQPAGAESSPDDDATRMFGSDEEFNRRADIALHGSQRGQYLSNEETDELAVWASNRQARHFADGQARSQERSQFSAAIMAAAGEFGVDASALQKPGVTMRDVFGAFVKQGETKQAEAIRAANDKIAKLEATNRQLADQLEGLEGRAPGLTRSVLRGGDAATSREARIADRSRMSGRQLMESGIRQQSNGRRNRPGAR